MYQYLTSVSDLIRNRIRFGLDVPDFADSLSETQYKSKKWLVDTLAQQQLTSSPTILIIGGWYGSYLIPMLKQAFPDCSIVHNDIDINTIGHARELHKRQKGCTFISFDAERSKEKFNVDVLINCSCEHMFTTGSNVISNPSCLYVLQSCDNENDPGHVNAMKSTEQFVRYSKLSDVSFCGRLNLGHKNRFMVIGRK